MTDKVDVIELGGTLFVPATHKNLLDIVDGKKYSALKSVVIDTEDAILDSQLAEAVLKTKKILNSFTKSSLLVFVRPRNTKVLIELLGCDGIENIDGFVLPKFSLNNADEYLKILQDSKYYIMPSIEGSELFNQEQLLKLRDKLLIYKDKIVAIRFGLEDMLRQLKMRRECSDSIFDFSATNTVLGNFLAIFKSSGFSISGGVYPCFKDNDGFIKDVKRDIKEGLLSKTIIHPNQIGIVNELYKVEQKELDEAAQIVNSKKAVFNQNDKMAETITMSSYSQTILKKAEVYGIK